LPNVEFKSRMSLITEKVDNCERFEISTMFVLRLNLLGAPSSC
jgi:hypothetical protein